MKTKLIKKSYSACIKKVKIITTLIGKEVAAVMASMLVISTGIAQTNAGPGKLSLGAGLTAQINANGYGSSYLPSVSVTRKRTTLNLSPIIQKRQLNLAGVQLSCQYALTGEPVTGERAPELFLSVQSAYYADALMGRNTLKNEHIANDRATEDNVDDLQFTSAEIFAGVGLRIRLAGNLRWVSTVALGGNTSFRFPSCQDMYFNGKNFGLSLGTGFLYNFR